MLGKRLRKQTLRSSHGAWQPAADRPNSLDLLKAQDEGRIQELLPIKYGRMAASPFAFLRGSAVVMAADLAPTPASGEYVLLCGDAHISNFGLFASPERTLVFDANDFDECYPGPWEWDLKRLAASDPFLDWHRSPISGHLGKSEAWYILSLVEETGIVRDSLLIEPFDPRSARKRRSRFVETDVPVSSYSQHL